MMTTTEFKIEPVNRAGQYKMATLNNYTKDQIEQILGFPPNIKDDPDKVSYSWGFTIDGELCGIWDYYHSHKQKRWSVFGPISTLQKLFGFTNLTS